MNKNQVTESVQRRLFELQDTEYRDFHAKLMPTVAKEKIIGIRTPVCERVCQIGGCGGVSKGAAP